MSRLDDALLGMDRKELSPSSIGTIPALAAAAPWRRSARTVGGAFAVIVVGAAGLAFALRATAPPPPLSANRPADAVASASMIPATPAPPAATSPAAPADGEATTLVARGVSAARARAFDEARGLFERALKVDPADAEGWNGLGVVLIRTGDLGKGVEAFRRAVRLQPRHAEANRNLAVALERQDRSEEAIPYYRAFLAGSGDRHPDRAHVRRRLAELGAPRRTDP
jgi:tetratricopeptide (TPR) repeat protein